MKKLLLGILLTLASFSVSSQQLEFLFYLPPGGSTDLHTNPVADGLKEQNFSLKKTFFKTCIEAVKYGENKDYTFLVSVTGDLNNNSGNTCPPLSTINNLKYYTNITEAPIMLCTSPTKANLNFQNMANLPTIVGVPRPNANWLPFHLFLKNNSQNLNFKVIPYKGAGDLKLAALAGNVDLVFMGSIARELVAVGSNCLASTMKDDPSGLPFIGTFTKMKNYPETSVAIDLWSFNTVSSNVDQAFRKSLSSSIFTEYTQRQRIVHKGLGKNIETKDQLNRLREIENLYNSLDLK